MNEEQQYINLIFNCITQNTSIENIIDDIDKRFKHSIPLNYYIAYYYEKKGDIDTATKRFKYCIQIAPKFTYPYFHIANYILSSSELNCEKLEKLLVPIFGKKTVILPTDTPKKLVPQFNLKDQLQIVNMLGPTYMRLKKYDKAIQLYKRGLQFLEDYTPRQDTFNSDYILCKKTFLLALGEASSGMDSYCYYSNGLFGSNEIDKKLFNGASLSLHYTYLTKEKLKSETKKLIEKANQIYGSTKPCSDSNLGSSIRKIKVGIISPDLNKNAVGLFCKALLLNLDNSLFDVFVYYTNPHYDNFTNDFKNEFKGTWIDSAFLDDNQLYSMMRISHSLDILIDLIGPGSMNKLNLISMKPAKIIINYLGYPGTGFLNSYTHRFVDDLTDPQTHDLFHESLHSEKLVRLPRFLNFTLFKGIQLPDINISDNCRQIRLGIMNKWDKFNKIIIDAWSEILEKNDNVVLYLKKSENSNDHSLFLEKYKDRIVMLPFYENLEEYLSAFNNFDLCLDTFPYSGTTTTCTSLLMGVPLFTVYDPQSNGHVSNVSGSILKRCKLDNFLCNNIDDYIFKVTKWISEGKLLDKLQVRKSFIDNMTNCEEFGNNLSNTLQNIFMEK